MEFFKKYSGPIIGVLVVIVIVVIGALVSKSTPGSESSEATLKAASSTQSFGASMFEAVTVGNFEYRLGGVQWYFTDTEQGETQVRLQIVGLTRSGVPITVLPYRLGTYAGDCKEMDMPDGLVTLPNEHPLGFSQCEHEDQSLQFIVTQSGTKIITRTRTLTQDSETPFEQIQSIDIANLPAAS